MSEPRVPAERRVLQHLVALDILQYALGVAIRAIVADFPEALPFGNSQRAPPPAQVLLARRLLGSMLRFDRDVATYRRRAVVSSEPDLLERDDG